jgi:hypothetical protein
MTTPTEGTPRTSRATGWQVPRSAVARLRRGAVAAAVLAVFLMIMLPLLVSP